MRVQSTEPSFAEGDYRQQLYRMSRDMLSVAGTDGYFKHVNPSFTRILGYSTSELLSVPFIEFVHPDDVPATLSEVAKLSEGNITIEFKNRYRCKDGTYKWLSWTTTPDLKTDLLYCVARDITRQKQIETRLLRAHRLESIGSFAGKIAHDLNNLLSPMRMAAEMLSTLNPNADPQSQRLFEVLERNARRGGQMVEQIVAFAKGSREQHVPIQMKKVAEDMRALISETFPRDVTAELDIEPSLWTVVGDPNQLYQVSLNLCVNSRDAMPAGGIIRLSLSNRHISEEVARAHLAARSGPYVSLAVQDTGVGIPCDLHEKILEPFFTTKQDQRGSGLGLATVQSIVEQHGGFLKLDSRVEQGSTFTVFLPATVD